MDKVFQILQLMTICATLLGIAFFVLLSLPQSKLRAFLLAIVGWGVVIFCGIYCISPLDIVPEALLGPLGLVDDLGAALTGVVAANAAMASKRD